MKKIGPGEVLILLACSALLLLQACNPSWDDHYYQQEEYVDMPLWDAVKEESKYSEFVSWVQENQLDTLFKGDLAYTLFVPSNSAFEAFIDTGYVMQQVAAYHVSPTLFLDRNVNGWKKLQTYLGKFAFVQGGSNGYTYDEIPMVYSSPLYKDGKYYEIAEVAIPRPNLYEYTALNSSVLKAYIDSRDSVFLDRSMSTPIGFDPDGNTIYDSVMDVANLFELEFFPVSQEFRDQSATFVLFNQEQYNEALDEMAFKLGGELADRDDIPLEWQNNVLLPDFTKSAMYEGMLSYADLMKDTLQSITGDSVIIDHRDIDPGSKYLCSNGVAYFYLDYSIADSLFLGDKVIEGEDLIEAVGAGKYAWGEGVMTTGEVIEPERSSAESASNGALVNIPFGRSFAGNYSLEFGFEDILPMRYRLEWRGSFRPSGLFAIYVNDEQIGEFDSFRFNKSVISVTGERFISDNGINSKDFWVENITEYGDVRIRFEYLGSGGQTSNGLNIDYINLIPVKNEGQ